MSAGFGRVVLGVVLVMSISAASYTAPSCKCSSIGTTIWLYRLSMFFLMSADASV
jgi:hypothetical protein